MARIVGTYCIIVHATEPPPEDEWLQLIDFQLSASSGGAVRVLVWTEGGAPDAAQRGALAARAAGIRMIIAILTPSVLARVAAVSIRLFQPDLRMLPPNDLDKALDFLEVPDCERAQLRNSLSELRNELSGVRSDPGTARC